MEVKSLWKCPQIYACKSSTWSQYKHHNMAKFLVACTPNGTISFVSPVFVGSISDIELTRESGFLTTLQDKPGISIMADRGHWYRVAHPTNYGGACSATGQRSARRQKDRFSMHPCGENNCLDEEFCPSSRDISYQYTCISYN